MAMSARTSTLTSPVPTNRLLLLAREAAPFVIAAVLTPPDVVSQLMLAIPMVILYEIGIITASLVVRRPGAQPPVDALPPAQ